MLNLLNFFRRRKPARKSVERANRFPVPVESLELRQMMIGGLSVEWGDNGVVRVTGSDADETILLERDSAGHLVVRGSSVTYQNGFSHVPNFDITQLVVDGGAGNDTIINATNLGVSMLGGSGDDTLIGGDGNDTLEGGVGNDCLEGLGGNDRLYGDDSGMLNQGVHDPRWQFIAAGDFDGNGHDDLLIHLPGTETRSILRMHNGHYLGDSPLGQIDDDWRIIGVGDFDADGDDDVMMHLPGTESRFVWVMQGGQAINGITLGSIDARWQVVGVGDFDGDGDDDAMMHLPGTETRFVWTMQGGHDVGGTPLGNIDARWQVVGVGKFDGDGDDDVLMHLPGTESRFVWVMQGGRDVGSTGLGAIDAGWVASGTADFTGDGSDDVLLRHPNGGVMVWGIYGASSSTFFVTPPGDDWIIAQVGDFDGDRFADIFWRNPISGENVVQSMRHRFVAAGSGNDQLHGGEGVDYLYGGGGFDELRGNGSDTFDNRDGDAIGDGAANADNGNYTGPQIGIWADAQNGIVTITGTNADNKILITESGGRIFVSGFGFPDGIALADVKAIVVNALDGNDTIINTLAVPLVAYAGAGDDTVFGGSGPDFLFGNSGNDILAGGYGADTTVADANVEFRPLDGRLIIHGTDANDVITVGPNADGTRLHVTGSMVFDVPIAELITVIEVCGQSGDDEIRLSSLRIRGELHGGAGNDTIWGSEVADQLYGDDGNDALDGNGGNDELSGGTGNDHLNGGADLDVLDFSHLTAGITVTLGNSTIAVEGTDTLLNVEGVVGTPFDDIFNGDGNDNYFDGRAGNDEINGGGGHDRASGGLGYDRMTDRGIEEIIDRPFKIDLHFETLTTLGPLFRQAAERWEEVIVGDLPNVIPFLGLFGSEIDDLKIEVKFRDDDGPGRNLASAGWDDRRDDGTGGLPYQGEMTFDRADLPTINVALIIHEMGHVLGIGTLWEEMGLLQGGGTANPIFTGANATAAYNALWSTSAVGVPVENTGGAGTQDSHWLETRFRAEVMTGFLNPNQNPLSRITVASLADLGYVVDMTAADPYAKPVAVADAYRTNEDNSLFVGGIGVLANDSDPDGDSLTPVLVSGVSNGTLTWFGNGAFRYTPSSDFAGIDSFTYRVNDVTGDRINTEVVTVSIQVDAVNDAPTAIGNVYRTTEDTSLNVAATNGVLQNDSNTDGDSLTAVLVSGVAHGTLTLNADGSFSYIPNVGFYGTNSFTYLANDGVSNGNLVTVTLEVLPVNDPPTILATTFSVTENRITAADVDAMDSRGDTLTYRIVGGADASLFSIDPTSGFLTFNVAPDFEAPSDNDADNDYEVTVQVSDGTLADVQTLSITVTNEFPMVAFNEQSGELHLTIVDAAEIAVRRANDGRVSLLVNGHPEFFITSAIAVRTIRINGSAGSDRIDLSSVTSAGFPNLRGVTVSGGEGNDTIFGVAKVSVSLDGGAGDDSLIGGAGNDTLNGGAGNDVLSGGDGNDSLNGGLGSDQIFESGVSKLTLSKTGMTGRGTDKLIGMESALLIGTDGYDTLSGGTFAGAIFIDGRGGNDSLTGGAGHDTLLGGDGNDKLSGLGGNDTIRGQAGNDQILGGVGNDALDGGSGDDVVNGEAGNDTILGGEGNDNLLGGADHDSIAGQSGWDTLKGEAGNDLLFGGIGDDSLSGGVGNDTLLGQEGKDTLRGEAGNDVAFDPFDANVTDATLTEKVSAFAIDFDAIFRALLNL